VNKVDLLSVLADVARALCRLHALGHIHRDVKARNVLITADWRTAKLADFGLARPLARPSAGGEHAESGGMTPRIGPRKYRAPEVEAGLAYGTPCDIYSYGVMVRELLSMLRSRTAKRYGASLDVLRLLSSTCMRSDPAHRPSASEALALLQQHLGSPLALGRLCGPAGALAGRLARRQDENGRKRGRSRSRSGSGTSARLVRAAAIPAGDGARRGERISVTSSA
jgi:serine/threonine-protein kinase 24/25/MST4